jgi:trimethylamine--corrinoid protein Co-methyltransferase
MQAAFLQPVVIDDDSMVLEAISDVCTGGHFFGTAHTMERYENAFYQPILSDWRNFETWQEDGSKTATQRANEIWKRLLAEYEKPAIDPAIEEELQTYMARRKEEIARE